MRLEVGPEMWPAVGLEVWPEVGPEVGSKVGPEVRLQVGPKVGPEVRLEVGPELDRNKDRPFWRSTFIAIFSDKHFPVVIVHLWICTVIPINKWFLTND